MRAQRESGFSLEYDEAGQGQPVVLLHAFPLARSMWRPQLQALQGAYHLLAPDLRGFGGTSGFEGTPSVEQMADDMVAWLDALALRKPVVLGGLSMGGYVALAFVRSYASRLRALILADTKAEADDAEGKANRDKMITFAEAHSPTEVVEQLLPKLLSQATRNQRPKVVDEVRRIGSAQTTPGLVGALRAMRDRSDASPVLGTIDVPTLVLVGQNDTVTPPAVAEKLAVGIRGARQVTIPEAGHLSNLEQPEAFNEAVRLFLDSLP
jgi:pimeloyl-ACP methyl ester carboxylesterase